jgi:quinol monooxygenase YgiN
MILIVLKAKIRPDKRDDWLAGIADYTASVRAEEGNVSFDYHENVDTPNEFVIVETFRDGDAGSAHVKTEHAQNFFPWMGTVVAERPKINYQDLEGDAWNDMAEVTPTD